MQRFTCGLFLFVALSCLWACKPSRQEAVEYSDRIINQQKAVHQKELQMLEALEDSTAVQGAYEAYMRQVRTAIDSVQKLEAFDGQTSFKDAALALFNTYRVAGETQYREVVKLMKKSDAQLTLEDKERASELLQDVREKLNSEVADLDSAQDHFAKQYNIELEEVKESK
jgi:hypothetical protein